ncbi:hypothetical protein ACFE04_026329 [Oxalis oulophora]
MRSESEDYPKKQQHIYSQYNYKLKVLLLIIITNVLTFYIFNGPNLHLTTSNYNATSQKLQLPSSCDQTLLSNEGMSELRKELNSTKLLVQALLIDLARQHDEYLSTKKEARKTSIDDQFSVVSNEEFLLAIGSHKLPLGYSSRSNTEDIYPSVGLGCLKYQEDLEKYMTYEVGGECPVDDVFAQKLMLKGCEPLPRRRCHPKSPVGYVQPTPFPKSLWTTPPDTSIIWDPYTCKSYDCLINRKKSPMFFDCKDCFDLEGRESKRWMADGGLDYAIDLVLKEKPSGSIRIGLDIGGGTGTFAARMRERNVTIITTSMNLDGPFNSFIASRGLVSMHSSISQRLPFFENTLDIVHSMHVLSNWIPDVMLEFLLYDIYRVLRPGGLFWLDHFFCVGSQLNTTYVPMLNGIGFKKLRWNAGMKLDKGVKKNEWYFSALFEKPMT